MNSIQKGLLTLMTAGVAAGAFVGCDEDDTFDINSPDWLESRVDSIAQSKANNATGDTVKVELSNTTVGDKDNSAGWWTVFSDIIGIPSGKKLTLEFDNYGSGADNWNNWNICVVNAKATSTEANENYKEYFVLRSDAYGWGGGMADEGYAYEAANISTNYADVAAAAGVDDQWALFKEKMQGAHTVMEIQHVAAGYVYLTATMTATDGTVLIEKYHQSCSAADDIYAFLACDGSHFENLSAVITPATIVISESNPARMELSNYPQFLTLGDTAFHAGIAAKIYFEDGTSADADTLDLSFVAPDLTTTGVKTVTVLYNKTSSGNFCAPIYASYTLQITDFRRLEIEQAEAASYFFPDGVEAVPFVKSSANVYGISGDGEKVLLDNNLVTFSSVAADGTFSFEYQGLTATAKANVAATGCTQVGATDFSSGWWTVFSADEQVKNGQTVTKTLQVRSDNLENFHCPIVILRTAALAEYAVLRSDNYGWGVGYDGNDDKVVESDWNWDTFKGNIDGSVYTISVTNNGATVDVKMSIVYANGETHFQNYTGIKASAVEQTDADDVFVSLTCEEAYLIIK